MTYQRSGMTTYFSKIKDIVLFKEKKKGMVYLYPITVDDIRAIFFPLTFREKYRYLGITWNVFDEGTEPYKELNEFIKYVDSVTKPWWCPRWFLRMTHLFGNDNSIVRIRNWKVYRLHNKITGGIIIQDIKTKWGTLRVYGSFTKEIQEKLDELEKKVNPYIEIY